VADRRAQQVQYGGPGHEVRLAATGLAPAAAVAGVVAKVSTASDSGSSVFVGMALSPLGVTDVCPAESWGYDVGQQTLAFGHPDGRQSHQGPPAHEVAQVSHGS